MVRQHSFAFLFLTLLLIGCGEKNQSGGDLNNSGSELNETGSATGYSDDVTDPGASLSDVTSALDNYPAQNADEEAAIQSAKTNITGYAQAYDALKSAGTSDDFTKFLQAFAKAQQQAQTVAQLLEAAHLYALAKAFWELYYKLDVMRFVSPITGRHLYTVSQAQAFNAATVKGMKFQGVIFRTYWAPREECSIPLYRCVVKGGSQDRFLTQAANCEGQTSEGLIGYVCPAQKPEAWSRIARLYSPSKGDHLITANQKEIAKRTRTGYRLESYLGYGPN